jgi:biotin carboxylase
VLAEVLSLLNMQETKGDATQKTLLILGAGIDQNYPIKIAKAEGLRVLAADSNPKAPGFAFADEAAIVSNRDVEALKKLCDESADRGFPVVGVLVMGADIPQIAAELALHLKIYGPSVETGLWTTNKFLMKEKLAQASVAVPWYAMADSFITLQCLMRIHGGQKFVIKPTDRSGARGVFLVHAEDAGLNAMYEEAKAESYSGKVIVEEFIEGDQISTESIIWRGKAYTPGFVDRNYEMLQRFAPSIIENGGTHPSKVSGPLRDAIEKMVERAAVALGIENGVAKGDVVIAEDGTPMIIEMAARLSGGDFSESLIPLGCGVNIVKAAIQIATEREPVVAELSDKWEMAVANRYFFGSPGKLVAIHGLEQVRALPWVRKLEVYVKPGDVIEQIKFHAGRIGVFIAVADTRDELQERVRAIYDLVRFEMATLGRRGIV